MPFYGFWVFHFYGFWVFHFYGFGVFHFYGFGVFHFYGFGVLWSVSCNGFIAIIRENIGTIFWVGAHYYLL
jgi:hypothetical protein